MYNWERVYILEHNQHIHKTVHVRHYMVPHGRNYNAIDPTQFDIDFQTKVRQGLW